MTLVLEIEYLSGVSFAARGPDSDLPDWPPQPDRIMSALVATWAAAGQPLDGASALEWLEQLPVPRLIASEAAARTAPVVFVPPNDPSTKRAKTAAGVLPMLRSRQPRRFPAARPDDPVVRVIWAGARPEAEIFRALERLARDTAYVGHSASLTRCRFVVAETGFDADSGTVPKRRVYPGRFAELRETFAAGRRPSPGALLEPALSTEPPSKGVFASRWLLLEHAGGEMPDLRASAIVARTIRDALLSGYERIGLGDRIPEIVSGHAQDGGPSRAPHLAIVPLPFVGAKFADGHVLGFALVPPGESSILDDVDFRRALRELAPLDEEKGRRILTVRTRQGAPSDRAFSIELCPTFESSRQSLEAAMYAGSSQAFATVTPIVLDRYLKQNGDRRQEEIAAQIASACCNIGLPEPVQSVANKHSAFEGAVSAYPSGQSPAWMNWRVPPFLSNRQLTHAVIRFPVPVAGPILLGAGRFVGLGLCRPLVRVPK